MYIFTAVSNTPTRRPLEKVLSSHCPTVKQSRSSWRWTKAITGTNTSLGEGSEGGDLSV